MASLRKRHQFYIQLLFLSRKRNINSMHLFEQNIALLNGIYFHRYIIQSNETVNVAFVKFINASSLSFYAVNRIFIFSYVPREGSWLNRIFVNTENMVC